MNGMHCYIISYDLCQPGMNYENLYKAIKSFPIWGRLTESTWAIVSERNHIEIRDLLIQHIDLNDRLIVVLSGKSAAWSKVIAPNEWVKSNLIY
ncbi:hypothetical protein [uncultured Bacteroides sp.]|uniref:hypothetical protein n=1 Tax=uncultured Bacteroides sp. TaxID=162156 RepID=UPI00260B94C7|nr:hypothetical protein [uncultured Bacteroides sp.]